MDALKAFNMIDLLMIGILALSLVLGYIRGFVRQLLSLAGLIAAYLAAILWFDDLAPFVEKIIPLSGFSEYPKYEWIIDELKLDTYFYRAVAFAVIFFGVKIALSVIGRLLHVVTLIPGIKTANRWGGALLAFCEAMLVIVIVLQILKIWPSEPVHNALEQSVAVKWMDTYLPSISETIQKIWIKEAPKS